MHRSKRVAGALAIVIVTALGGLAAGSRISSPADVAARAASPEPSPILVPVEHRQLSTDVVTRGTGRYGSPQKLTVATSALKASAGIVATVAPVGAALEEGSVVASASGRPTFLLLGPRPTARDLGPGLSGEDVGQLEASLARLGFDPGPLDGHYDEATEAAVTQFYRAQGFAPFTATSEQLGARRTRQSEMVLAAAEAVTASAGRDAAETALAQAGASAATAAERADLAGRQLARARTGAALANQAADAEWASSQADPITARASRDLVHLASQRTVDEALIAAQAAKADVVVADLAVQGADIARSAARQVALLRTQSAALAAEEATITRSRSGVQVPADEIVFVPAPVRVTELKLGPGDMLAGTILTASDAILYVGGGLAVRDAGLVTPGMAVRIEEPDLGISAQGVVRSVAQGPGTNGMDGFHVYIEVEVASPPAKLAGASVRLTIPVVSSGGRVLAVPLGALTMAADGSSRVQRDRDGLIEYITVQPGLSADGYVAITPITDTLVVEDLVVVGMGPTPELSGPATTATTPQRAAVSRG